jgi:NADH-quinone oxidoreductase subunit N
MDVLQMDLISALPEMFVLGMAMLILLLDLFIKPSSRQVIDMLAQVTLLGAAYLTLRIALPSVTYSFSGMFVSDIMGAVLKLMIYLSSAVTLVYSRQYLIQRNMYRGEFFALVLFAVAGMMVMVSGAHFLTIYMGLELLSLSLYALVAMDRDNVRATEAAMKYFVLGALASGMLLYGMSMLYGATGSLQLREISSALLEGHDQYAVLVLGLVFVVAGIAFKLGAVPFQMWVPDVYEGSPTPVTLVIGAVSKLSGFAFAVRLLAQGLDVMAIDWQGMIIIIAVLSIAIGNVTAIAQTNIKRMFAYSTISHVGFLLYGVMSASMNGFASSMFYISAYVLMSLAGFGMILLLSRKGFEADKIDDFRGLNQRSPWFAFMMLISIFSMAGVPPTLGFYAKFTVLQSALQAGFVGLVIFAVLMAVVGAFYYLRIVKVMYFDEPVDSSALSQTMSMKTVLSINALALLLLGLFPQSLMSLSGYAISHSLQ